MVEVEEGRMIRQESVCPITEEIGQTDLAVECESSRNIQRKRLAKKKWDSQVD